MPRFAPPSTLPKIPSELALADWLCVSPSELAWFADRKHIATSGALSHYRYHVLTKPSGGVRLIEAPKFRMKCLQKRILTGILEHMPPHPAVHGFVKGRSVKTFAAGHTGRPGVLRIDLENFFATIRKPRVAGVFRTLGYKPKVAAILAALCTHSAPKAILDGRPERFLYYDDHLPQGAPTSPLLANLCAYRADCRLAALAKADGSLYTRYADDIAFSGFVNNDLAAQASAILAEEGFTVNHHKTRLMGDSVRQHLAGLVVNVRTSIPRSEYDRLKAILTNCLRHGMDSQNRDKHPDFRAHLAGKVAWVSYIHPERGARLSTLLAKL
jgi:retron-type reverse transcriptase